MALMSAPKALVTPLDWSVSGSGRRHLEMRGVLIRDGVTMRGVQLFLNCPRHRPEERVSLGFLMEFDNRPRCVARIDWRGSQHANNNTLCGTFIREMAGRSHFHDPALFPPPADFRAHIKEDLPIAQALDPEPENFEALLNCCARILNVTNMSDIPVPPWQPSIP
jgi:hypothetical protein